MKNGKYKIGGQIILVPQEEIYPNPNQPRKRFDFDELESLAQSIRQNGIIQPIAVRVNGKGEYELISGERRLRASRLVGITQIPCIIMDASDEKSALFALLENIQRCDLGFFEEAQAIEKLIVDFGMSRDEVCKKLGCGNTRALRIFRELEAEGLIVRKRNNCCMPYKIYITERFSEYAKQELANAENDNSRIHKIKPREFTKREYSKNNNSNNKFSNNHSSIIGFERTEEEIREQIEYEYIVCDANKNLLDEMVMIIFDVLNGTSPTVRVGKDEMPRSAVISRFCKLNSEHIYYVFLKLDSNETKINNIKPYLITLLYNAPATMETEVTVDFAYYQKIS